MSGQTTPSPVTDRDEADTWPWECLDCGATIYHDGEFCRSCDSAHRPATYRGPDTPGGFVEWMRDQTAPAFVLKVSTVAGLELALTAFWLQTLLYGSFDMASVVPIVP